MLHKLKVYWKKFKIRMHTIKLILSRKNDHWVLFYFDEEALTNLLSEGLLSKEVGDIDIKFNCHGMQKFVVHLLIRKLAQSQDDIEFMLDKATFEAEAEEYFKNKKK